MNMSLVSEKSILEVLTSGKRFTKTPNQDKVVAWKQMIQLSGKYIIYVNKAILTIAAVKVFSDKEVFSFTSNLLESQGLMGYQMSKFFPAI